MFILRVKIHSCIFIVVPSLIAIVVIEKKFLYKTYNQGCGDHDPSRKLQLPDPAGSCRKEARKSLDSAGKHRRCPDVEVVFQSEICRIFSRWILVNFRQESIRNHREKTEKFPVRILLPRSGDFRCFSGGNGPYILTWGGGGEGGVRTPNF